MTGIVRLALVRPYTFVVMAILILILGVMSIKRTPTDIFPEIGIPVISVVWSYTGLPPADMSGRIVSIYERVLTTTVNDIEHIESQSVPGYGIVKIYFQPSVNIAAAQSQVVSISQTILKQLPAGHHAAADDRLQRLERADHPARAVEPDLVGNRAAGSRPQLRPPGTRHDPRSAACRIPTAARCGRCRSTSTRARCGHTASPPPRSVPRSPSRT